MLESTEKSASMNENQSMYLMMAAITSILRTHQVTFMVIIIRICGESARKRITKLTSASYSVCTTTDYLAPYSTYNLILSWNSVRVSVR